MYRLLICLALLAGCHAHTSPQLRVLGVHDAPAREVVFVQVTNPASSPMRLTKLEYTFAAAGTTLSAGEVPLERDVPAGAAVVVEVPLDTDSKRPMMLKGTLVAELDQMVREFQISAQIQPH
ncbi:MAG: LEA type 2 family protein [Deltaproteobacteria bacterium]|nr:LEA type 2 family protein [Deltaproteobacteria bacterium]